MGSGLKDRERFGRHGDVVDVRLSLVFTSRCSSQDLGENCRPIQIIAHSAKHVRLRWKGAALNGSEKYEILQDQVLGLKLNLKWPKVLLQKFRKKYHTSST